MKRPALTVVLVLGLVPVAAVAGAQPASAHSAEPSVAMTCRRALEQPTSELPIVRRVCRDVPALRRLDTTASNLRAVDLIREWAFRNVDSRIDGEITAADGTRRGLLVPPDAWKMSASGYLRIFDRDELGALCGDTAWFLLRVYDAFGLEAFIYNYGLLGTHATHVITLVRVDGDLIPEDAYFDQTIRGSSGEPLDFGVILSRMRYRDADAIRFVPEQPFPDREVLFPDTAFDLVRPLIGSPGTLGQGLHDCHHLDGYWTCRDSWHVYASVAVRNSDFGALAMDTLAAAGWPRSADFLTMYPIGVSSAADGWTPRERINESTPAAAVLREIYSAISLEPGAS